MSEGIYAEERDDGITVYTERPPRRNDVVEKQGGNGWFVIMIVSVVAIVGILIIAAFYARGMMKRKYNPPNSTC